jgi:hypothetical protein
MKKNGHTQKQLDEVKVVLTKDDVEVYETCVRSEREAKQLLESWINGTYRLLTE